MAAGDDQRYQRDRLVQELRRRGIRDEGVLDAIRAVPRHLFVDDHLRAQAYRDNALPIREGQTISQPWVVARMTELLQVEPSHSVLEIGTGSGYQTAVLAQLARVVYSIERIAPLARDAIARMRQLGIQNVKIHVFDGTSGWSEAAPYPRILVTAGAPTVPPRLLEQLEARGRLVVPEGDRESQVLAIYEKGRTGRVQRRAAEQVAFVPLVGKEAWPERDPR